MSERIRVLLDEETVEKRICEIAALRYHNLLLKLSLYSPIFPYRIC